MFLAQTIRRRIPYWTKATTRRWAWKLFSRKREDKKQWNDESSLASHTHTHTLILKHTHTLSFCSFMQVLSLPSEPTQKPQASLTHCPSPTRDFYELPWKLQALMESLSIHSLLHQRVGKVLPHSSKAQKSYEEAYSRAHKCLQRVCFTTQASKRLD